MENVNNLPCNPDGVCMRCKKAPAPEETLTCNLCKTPWHVTCLSTTCLPETLASTVEWNCPDCTTPPGDSLPAPAPVAGGSSSSIVAEMLAIDADVSLTEKEKAMKKQELMGGKVTKTDGGDDDDELVLGLLNGNMRCPICSNLLTKPVTTPCGHNFCLDCFKRTMKARSDCATCRSNIPVQMTRQPRINSIIVAAIRAAKKKSKSSVAEGPLKEYLHNQDRPDEAYTTERAKKKGKANAASGRIFVNVPSDHFGPILPEHDPENKKGVPVGMEWKDRLECRQWGAHFPHVAGIAGQSKVGAQSVVLSGGYEDDEDHGEWFLYTGSGGTDLSGNKRTNKEKTSDQKFEGRNEALRVSCQKGYPVRVIRSHKIRSPYAPDEGLRYEGIYRIEKCWQKVGQNGLKICRYLFVRCDNAPAPWISDELGDRPTSLPNLPELEQAYDIVERKESPAWDFDEVEGSWKWQVTPPASQNRASKGKSEDIKKSRKAARQAQDMTIREDLKEFSCLICHEVMKLPVTTPCAHNFCKLCLEGAFAGQNFVRERSSGGRTLRSQKNVMKCPSCPNDISDFLKNLKVNGELMDVIESLKRNAEDDGDAVEEPNKEETDGAKENRDLISGSSSKTTRDISAEAGPNDNLQNPPVKSKPKRTRKRRKVNDEGCLLKNEDEKDDPQVPVVKVDGGGSSKPGVGMDDDNDSTSSPLVARPDEDPA